MTIDRIATVPARMESLAQALAFVDAFCAECSVARNDALRIALIVEELFTNTVVHGHGGDCDAPIRIGLGADAVHLELVYEDTAPPFDPLARAARSTVDLEADVADRPVGHLGLALVVQMAARCSYQRETGLNRLRLSLRRQG